MAWLSFAHTLVTILEPNACGVLRSQFSEVSTQNTFSGGIEGLYLGIRVRSGR